MKMKKLVIFLIGVFSVFSMTACQKVNEEQLNALGDEQAGKTIIETEEDTTEEDTTEEDTTEEDITEDDVVQSESDTSESNISSEHESFVDDSIDVTESDSIQSANNASDSENKSVSYVGEYNDYDYDEPNLQIKKNEDGTYLIQIGIVRLAAMDDCTGYETENGIEFLVNDWDWNNGEISGIITLDGDIATVTFTAGWIGDTNEYKYHKTSDIPNIWGNTD